ncbi:MAG TPA: septal ring lytic transglycosylase RlpA family protein [Streptosporangiales bacterium]
MVLTGLAGAGAAAVGTSQAAAEPDASHAAPHRQVVTQVLSLHGQPAPASREHRVRLGEPDVRGHLRTIPPTNSPSPSASGGSADGPVTATGHCVASYYDTGSVTANGEPFDTSKLTAANKTLPFGTRVKVINDATKQSVVVRINDRGPYVAGRCLDLTPAAMRILAGPSVGTVQVTYQVLGRK